MNFRYDPDAYVLGLIEPGELRDAEVYLQENPEFAAAVRDAERLTQMLGQFDVRDWQTPQQTLPVLDFDAITSGSGVQKPEPTKNKGSIFSRFRFPAVAVLPALAATAAAGVFVGTTFNQQGAPSTVTVTSTVASAPADRLVTVDLKRFGKGPRGAYAQASMAPRNTRKMRLVASGLKPVRRGQYYELWLIKSPQKMVSIGTFTIDKYGSADVEYSLGVDPAKYPLVDVSIESAKDGPAHSGKSVLRSSAV